MKITEVTYENWGPYFGSQTLDISTGKADRVIVVHGENGNGKTKLIDGLKWVFSGGQHGLVKVGPYINLQAIDESKPFETSVSVRFRQGKSEFLLRRAIKFDPTVLADNSAENIKSQILSMPDKSRVHLEKVGGEAYNFEQTSRVMERLFPARLVGFYFFDAAKLLDNFGTVSGGQSSSGGLSLRVSVEMAMGLRGLDVFTSELKKIEIDLRNRSVQDSKNKDALQKLLADLRSAESDRERATASLGESRSNLFELQAEKEDLNAKLAGAQNLIEAQTSRNRLQFELDSISNNERIMRSRIPELVKNLWMSPMLGTLETVSAGVSARAEGRLERKAQALFLQQQLAYFEKQAQSNVCLACGQETSHSEVRNSAQLALLKSQLSELSEAANSSQDNADAELEVLLKSSIYTEVIRHRSEDFADYKRDLDKLIVKRIAITEELEQLKLVFGELENTDLLTANQRFLDVERLISDSKRRISADLSLIEDCTAQIARAKLKMAKFGSVENHALDKLSKVQTLIEVIERVAKQLREDVRHALNQEANAIFAQIRSESDGSFEITVDEEYRLSTSKHNPNAAYMQQVFLSFLFAIPRVAQAPFPVVIDSPIQHLDLGNRMRFVDWCKSGLSQLVLLPHDGEILPEDTGRMFGDALAHHYVITHSEKTGKSIFTRLGGNRVK